MLPGWVWGGGLPRSGAATHEGEWGAPVEDAGRQRTLQGCSAGMSGPLQVCKSRSRGTVTVKGGCTSAQLLGASRRSFCSTGSGPAAFTRGPRSFPGPCRRRGGAPNQAGYWYIEGKVALDQNFNCAQGPSESFCGQAVAVDMAVRGLHGSCKFKCLPAKPAQASFGKALQLQICRTPCAPCGSLAMASPWQPFEIEKGLAVSVMGRAFGREPVALRLFLGIWIQVG